jgi:hypothetical protein
LDVKQVNMRRVKHVEKIFASLTALAIVEQNGNQGENHQSLRTVRFETGYERQYAE